MYQATLLIFPALMAFAAASDLFTMRIPNWLTAALALAFPLNALLVGFDWPLIGTHLGVGLMMLVIGMVMFAAGWLGGGDAKLLAAIAVWFGPSSVLVEFLLIAALAGGALT